MENKHKITPADERELLKIAAQLPRLQKTNEDGKVIMETVTIKRKGSEFPKGTLCKGVPLKANKRYTSTYKRPVYLNTYEHLRAIFKESGHEGVEAFIDSIEEAIKKQVDLKTATDVVTED